MKSFLLSSIFTLLPLAIGALRGIVDQREKLTLALPAAAGTADSASSIFIGTGPHVERLEVQVVVPATPALVDAKTVTLTLQDSADGSSFANIAGLDTIVLTGAGGAGASATTREVRLPSSFRGYLRLRAAVQSAGGDNTAVTVTLNILH